MKENGEMEMLEELTFPEILRHAILKSFDPSDTKLPVLTLRKTLKRRPEIIHHLEPQVSAERQS